MRSFDIKQSLQLELETSSELRLSSIMRTDEEAQAIAQPSEEAETAGNGRSPSLEADVSEKPAQKPQDAVTMEDRIEVKLEGREHPWNWTKTR